MTTPLTTHLARQLKLEVDTAYPGSATPTWIPVKGVNSLQPTISPTMQETTDYDTDGWADSTKTLLGWGLGIGLMRKGADSASYDPGQQKLRAAAYQFGEDGVVHLRWYDREGGDEAYEGYAEVQWAPAGGDAKALDTVQVTLTGKGARTTIANPAATPVVPTVAGRTPASGGTAGGTLVTITGDNFTGVTGAAGVKFGGAGGTNATSYQVIDDQHISAVTPARTAGAAQIVVTNATGPSTDTVNFTYA